jgi:miniconductance mechanosensitive channel
MNTDAIFYWLYNLLINNAVSNNTASLLNLCFNIIALAIVLWVIDFLFKKIIVTLFETFSVKTKTSFDNYLVKSNFPKYIAHIIPFLIIRWLIPIILRDFTNWQPIATEITDVYLIILIVWIFRSIVKTTKNYLKEKEAFKDKPLESFAQVVILFLWFIGSIFIFSELTNQDILKFLTTLGATSAVLLLVFRDTILGFVASIQVSVNDMVRIGDWITLNKYGADGTVTEITLTTVKVKNFDNTITTIPTYSLISDSFKNWRGMEESGGRRIKRTLFIKQNSVKFLESKDLIELTKVDALKSYIEHRQKDIDEYNTAHGFNKEVIVNGRNQTNLGVFRKYCEIYLSTHPAINQDLTIMTRHLEPTPNGIPLELYAFSKDKRWVNYEYIMADIFEHLIAAASHFNLELYEYPTGKDFIAIKS